MTGDNATIGNQMRTGVEAAIEDINAHGGVLGEKLTLVVEDDACNAKLAVPVANKLIAEGRFPGRAFLLGGDGAGLVDLCR